MDRKPGVGGACWISARRALDVRRSGARLGSRLSAWLSSWRSRVGRIGFLCLRVLGRHGVLAGARTGLARGKMAHAQPAGARRCRLDRSGSHVARAYRTANSAGTSACALGCGMDRRQCGLRGRAPLWTTSARASDKSGENMGRRDRRVHCSGGVLCGAMVRVRRASTAA
ncbi:hypothetical protein D3C83_09710 [compost metagenome]